MSIGCGGGLWLEGGGLEGNTELEVLFIKLIFPNFIMKSCSSLFKAKNCFPKLNALTIQIFLKN